ncbi:hypothetical protein Q0O37_13880, partial [Staphylococcus aureus]|nr:hypothetical protein [Staphylococcus aureus]
INSGNVTPFSGIFEIRSLEQLKSFQCDNPEKPRPDLSFVISGKYLLHNVFFDETRVSVYNYILFELSAIKSYFYEIRF